MNTVYITEKEYSEWIKAAKKNYGNNPLEWPEHLRKSFRALSIVQVEPLKPVQMRIPYSNTGVGNQDAGNHDV